MYPITAQVKQNSFRFDLSPDDRKRYKIEDGDTLYLVELAGVLILTPKQPLVAQLSHEIEQARIEAGLSMDEMLLSLQEERERYVAEHYDL